MTCRSETDDDPASKVIDLLSLEGVQLHSVSALGEKLSQFRILTDDDRGRSIEISLEPGVPFDLLYSLPDLVTCHEIAITAATLDLKPNALPRFEVLASILSGESGFQSLRSASLKASNKTQSIKFPASAGQWFIIRLVAGSDQSTKLRVSEFDLLGKQGAPETRYAFKEAPAKALDVLASVEQSVALKLSPDERSLFKDAQDGKLDTWTFAEAALLTSGVKDKKVRQKHLATIDQLTAEAKDAIEPGKTKLEEADLLLKWLHKEVMSKGYKSKQTDVATILQTGEFNCVSSATLYNIIGRRLGLDLRAIEVPDHAFSILYIGSKHADVETTTPHGFNPSSDLKVLREFTQQTGFRYIADRHGDQRREVKAPGLLALTYYNHGVVNSKNKRYAQALSDYFRALSLDPGFSSAIKNVVAVIGSWAKELEENKQYAQATQVLGTGARLAPNDKGIQHNHRVIWQNWAVDSINGGQLMKALEILADAHKAIPTGGFERLQVSVFIQPGEKHADRNEWSKAIELAGQGLPIVSKSAQAELKKWRNSLFHRWTGYALKSNDFAKAADILEQAVKVEPGDKRFAGNTAYVVQEWLRSTHANDGAAAAGPQLERLAKRFGQTKRVVAVIESFTARTAKELATTGKLIESLEFIDRHAKQLPKGAATKLKRSAIDGRASAYLSKKDWANAIEVYTTGLRLMPKDEHLTNNLHAVWDRRANVFRQAKAWNQAADVYAKALDSGLDDPAYAKKVGYCVQQLVLQSAQKDGRPAAEKHILAWKKKRPKLKQIGELATI